MITWSLNWFNSYASPFPSKPSSAIVTCLVSVSKSDLFSTPPLSIATPTKNAFNRRNRTVFPIEGCPTSFIVIHRTVLSSKHWLDQNQVAVNISPTSKIPWWKNIPAPHCPMNFQKIHSPMPKTWWFLMSWVEVLNRNRTDPFCKTVNWSFTRHWGRKGELYPV